MISRRPSKAVRGYALASLAMVFMSAPCSAADVPQPLRLTPENGHDFLCHLYLYNAYTNLASSNGSEDSIKASYASASYFIGKLVGRNGDNFSVGADAVEALKKPYAAADQRSEFMRGCLNEYNAVFGKIEERQG
jgi:hypothetical protein